MAFNLTLQEPSSTPLLLNSLYHSAIDSIGECLSGFFFHILTSKHTFIFIIASMVSYIALHALIQRLPENRCLTPLLRGNILITSFITTSAIWIALASPLSFHQTILSGIGVLLAIKITGIFFGTLTRNMLWMCYEEMKQMFGAQV